MTTKRLVKLTGAAMILALAPLAFAQDFDLSWHTLDGGGGFSAGGNFELEGTLGQPDAGAMSGGDFEMTGGFWFPVVTGDCNGDGNADLGDYADFKSCLLGPGGGLGIDCNCFDFDHDGDVDIDDLDAFQLNFTGN